MLRLTLKFPHNGLARFQRCGNSRHLSLRYPQFQSQTTGHSKSGGGGGVGFGYTFGFLALTTGGTIAYAHYDPVFREWLKSHAPWTDSVISVVFQEDKTWEESFHGGVEKVREGTRKILFWEKKNEEDLPDKMKKKEKDGSAETLKAEFKAPRPVFSSLVSEPPKPPPDKKNWKEIRLIPKDEDIEIVSSEKPDLLSGLPETHPMNLAELEKKISETSVVAVSAYKEAIAAVRGQHEEVMKLIEQAGDGTDECLWQKLKTAGEQKEKLVREAEEKASKAAENVSKLKKLVEDQNLEAPDRLKDAAMKNITDVMEGLCQAQTQLAEEKQKSALADKYWRKVYDARQHYLDEIRILFPDFRISNKEWNISKQDLDLFIYYCFRNVLHYQKELAKLETFGAERLRAALNESGEHVDKELVEGLVADKLEKQRRELESDFLKKKLEIERTVEKNLRNQLKRQAEAHSDHLTDAVSIREKELEREYIRRENEKLTTEQDKFKMQLSGMMGRLHGLEAALKARAHVDKAAHQAQALWSACQGLHVALRRNEPGIPWSDQLKPLTKEITAVQKAALKDDDIVKIVLDAIPCEAKIRGVYSEAALRDRFIKVEKSARRLALVSDEGASLPVYILSYLQSVLLIKSATPIPLAEIQNEPRKFNCLDTYDILQRARYWMDRGNIDQTLRYMNLLKGASRAVASDWMNEARILLETKQAANVLMTHASASGLLYI